MDFYDHTAETERLLTENYGRYYHLAYKLIRDRDDALDVVQKSAYQAVKDCKGIKDKDYLSTWIYRIVISANLDMLRRRKKETPTEEMPKTLTEDHYQDLDLKQVTSRLDDKNRTVILLRYFEDLKPEGVADVASKNLDTVKVRPYHVLKGLRLELEPGSLGGNQNHSSERSHVHGTGKKQTDG